MRGRNRGVSRRNCAWRLCVRKKIEIERVRVRLFCGEIVHGCHVINDPEEQ